MVAAAPLFKRFYDASTKNVSDISYQDKNVLKEFLLTCCKEASIPFFIS